MEWSDFLGPMGGFGAVCFGSGAIASWKFSQKIIGGFLREQIDLLHKQLKEEREECSKQIKDLQRQIEQERKTCDEKITKLETRVITLEKSRLEIAMDKTKT